MRAMHCPLPGEADWPDDCDEASNCVGVAVRKDKIMQIPEQEHNRMLEPTLHPNSLTLLSAWQRMHAEPMGSAEAARTSDHPDLISRLFVIQDAGENDWAFRSAGERIEASLGRQLADYNFLGFWTGPDREMIALLLRSAVREQRPAIVRACAENLTGERVDVELIFAPLMQANPAEGSPRMLGLYQTLANDRRLKGRPVWRHRLTAIFPPDIRDTTPRVQLVANND